ncbi:MAG: hypothetical protein CSA63_01150 [Propionibacterium sp.]|nr:MAG: hypothetical protein CSA63_01150 [Propionibacterium sp.]
MSLFLVGGPPSDKLSDVYARFAEEAVMRSGQAGQPLRVAVAILSDGPQDVGAYTQYLPEGFEAEIVPVLLEGETVWPEPLANISGIIVGGGPTGQYLQSLMPKRAELLAAVTRDIPYLGFSAGAMVTSKYALVGGWQADGRQVCPESGADGLESVTVEPGLALIGVTVETHCDTDCALGRAEHVARTGRSSSVVAIDEDTALVVDAITGRANVLGTGCVFWLSRHSDRVEIRAERAKR